VAAFVAATMALALAVAAFVAATLTAATLTAFVAALPVTAFVAAATTAFALVAVAFVVLAAAFAVITRWFVLVEAGAAHPTPAISAAGKRQRAAGAEHEKPNGKKCRQTLPHERSFVVSFS
jgi:hypothetical protein